MRRIIASLWIALLLVLVVVFVYQKRVELADIGRTLAAADVGWVAVVGLLELFVLAMMAKTYQVLLGRLGRRVGLLTLAMSYVHAMVIGAVVPFGGPTSVYVFVRNLHRRGVPADDALLATGLNSLVGYASFIIILVPVLVLLDLQQLLSRPLVLAAGLLIGLFTILLLCLLLVLRGPRPPLRVTRRTPKRLLKFIEAARDHDISLSDLRRPLALALGVDLAGVMMVYAALRAVGQSPSLIEPLIGYQVEMLFNVISPLFQGVGLVELSMTAALEGAGVPVAAALAATLVYRVWDLWFPLALGLAVHAYMDGRGHEPPR